MPATPCRAAYFTVKEQVPHLWPVSKMLAPWPMGERFFWETKRGVLSYVIARPLMTAVSVVTNIAGGWAGRDCVGRAQLGGNGVAGAAWPPCRRDLLPGRGLRLRQGERGTARAQEPAGRHAAPRASQEPPPGAGRCRLCGTCASGLALLWGGVGVANSPPAAAAALLCAGVYGEGEFRRDRAYPYVALVNNFTQMWALYCLVLLYQVRALGPQQQA